LKCRTLQRFRKPSGGRLLNLQDPPSPLTFTDPHPQPSVVKYCVTSNQQIEDRGSNKNERDILHPPQFREPLKIFPTRGVTPLRRIPTSSSSSTSPAAIAPTDGSSSIDEQVFGDQRGKWIFPTPRSIYVEESQQTHYDLRNSHRNKGTTAMPDGELKPPHHYTGPGMFRGLSPRLPSQSDRPREFLLFYQCDVRPWVIIGLAYNAKPVDVLYASQIVIFCIKYFYSLWMFLENTFWNNFEPY
uniref:Uncharacterized protein n=1 Tax=Hydatigena taeniaeformis TaxID=6205 RepID=A0A0R3WY43_HYDTA